MYMYFGIFKDTTNIWVVEKIYILLITCKSATFVTIQSAYKYRPY